MGPGQQIAQGFTLEGHPQTKLDYAWKVVLGSNLTEVWRAETRVRRTKLWVIEEVEELCAEFEAESIIGAELRVLERSEVNVLASVSPKIRFCPAIGSIAEAVGECECRGIEPLDQRLI